MSGTAAAGLLGASCSSLRLLSIYAALLGVGLVLEVSLVTALYVDPSLRKCALLCISPLYLAVSVLGGLDGGAANANREGSRRYLDRCRTALSPRGDGPPHTRACERPFERQVKALCLNIE